jgi:phosphoribosyl 1,2-cyclic phosphodiesterase
MPVYASRDTIVELERFAASTSAQGSGSWVFNTEPRPLTEQGTTEVCGVRFTTLSLKHTSPLTGVLVHHDNRSFAHLSDTGSVVEGFVREAIRSCDLLVVHTPSLQDAEAHMGVTGAISLAQDVGAKRLVLTHLGHTVPQDALAEIEDAYPWVTAAYDGMKLDF